MRTRYHGESGTLNESVSDVFGSIVKQWHRKQTVDQADRLSGDELIADKKLGKALRSLKAPGTAYDNTLMGGQDPQPAHYRNYYGDRADDGGVHTSRWFQRRSHRLKRKRSLDERSAT